MFERSVRRQLAADGEFEILDSTDSFDDLDFELGCRGRRVFLEVKEKKQRYRDRWTDLAGIPEERLFILDELSVRKIMLRCPRAFLLVHDAMTDRLSLFGALELLTVPKSRVNRSIDGGVATFKGKWLVDLSHAAGFDQMPDALDLVKRRIGSEDEAWKSLACHGRYEGEVLPRL